MSYLYELCPKDRRYTVYAFDTDPECNSFETIASQKDQIVVSQVIKYRTNCDRVRKQAFHLYKAPLKISIALFFLKLATGIFNKRFVVVSYKEWAGKYNIHVIGSAQNVKIFALMFYQDTAFIL